jgi:hypothetical protein
MMPSRLNPKIEVRRYRRNTGGESLNRKRGMKATINNDLPVEVVISRSAARRCWVVLMGGHSAPLPWADSADATTVASWVKANAGGKVIVQVRL